VIDTTPTGALGTFVQYQSMRSQLPLTFHSPPPSLTADPSPAAHVTVTLPSYPCSSHATSNQSSTSLSLPYPGTAIGDDTPTGALGTFVQYSATRSQLPLTSHCPTPTSVADIDDPPLALPSNHDDAANEDEGTNNGLPPPPPLPLQVTVTLPSYPSPSHATSNQSSTSLSLP